MSNRVFLSAHWRHLAMLNYECDPSLLMPFVPYGTELDLFEGRAYVSIVAFLFQETRIAGIPIPFHRNFEEVNLRFYVRRVLPGESRRGVVFIQELVPRRMIAWTARAFYNEKYETAKMSHVVKAGLGRTDVRFEWHCRGEGHFLRVNALQEAAYPIPGSQEQFIAEHYFGYAAQRNGDTVEYAVRHPPWKLHPVTQYELKAQIESLYGAQFAPTLKKEPASIFLAEGSPVQVSLGSPMKRKSTDLPYRMPC